MKPKHGGWQALVFAIGDAIGGALTGGATAAAVGAVVAPDMDMVLAMMLGMAVGMLVHLPFILVLTPVLGAFHVMVPGSIIGMYGGMFFAMRDTMQGDHASSFGHVVMVGAWFGIAVTAVIHVYDQALRDRSEGSHA